MPLAKTLPGPSTWIFALYPESILLGASAMREPYLLTFSAFALWGFVVLFHPPETTRLVVENRREGWLWLGLGLLGMLLVSPAVALVTIVILAGWVYFTNEGREISWKGIVAVAAVFILGLFLLSSSLNRASQFDATSPLHVINDWLKLAVKWDAYQLERDSGWIQKIFDEGPRWIRLPFIAIYGIFQPILPATLIHPTKLIWTSIGFLRGLGWYAILPLLILSFGAATGSASRKERNLILWLSLLAWIWILLAPYEAAQTCTITPAIEPSFSCGRLCWQAMSGSGGARPAAPGSVLFCPVRSFLSWCSRNGI